jgi:hypothetical protein
MSAATSDDLKNLAVGKKLVRVQTTYSNGAEHLSLLFEDPETGERVRCSVTAERGSDLWIDLRKVSPKKK